MLEIKGRTVVITGGATGIGFGIAKPAARWVPTWSLASQERAALMRPLRTLQSWRERPCFLTRCDGR